MYYTVFNSPLAPGTAQWLQMAQTLQKYVSPEVISRIFPSKFQQIWIISVSSHFIHFIFKICQTAADKIKQFHEFFSLIFGGILQLGPNVHCIAERLMSNEHSSFGYNRKGCVISRTIYSNMQLARNSSYIILGSIM